jgi:hypothetical protein
VVDTAQSSDTAPEWVSLNTRRNARRAVVRARLMRKNSLRCQWRVAVALIASYS